MSDTRSEILARWGTGVSRDEAALVVLTGLGLSEVESATLLAVLKERLDMETVRDR